MKETTKTQFLKWLQMHLISSSVQAEMTFKKININKKTAVKKKHNGEYYM